MVRFGLSLNFNIMLVQCSVNGEGAIGPLLRLILRNEASKKHTRGDGLK